MSIGTRAPCFSAWIRRVQWLDFESGPAPAPVRKALRSGNASASKTEQRHGAHRAGRATRRKHKSTHTPEAPPRTSPWSLSLCDMVESCW